MKERGFILNKKNTCAGFAILLTLLCSTGAQAAGIVWKHSLSEGLRQAKATHKLVMLDIYTDWCYWCKRLDTDTYPKEPVIKAASQVVPVKLNAEKSAEGREAASKYQVTGYPSILFLNGDGGVVGKITGYETAEPFAASINQYVEVYNSLPILESKFRSDPSNGALGLKLIKLYASTGAVQKAAAILPHIERADPKGSKGYLTDAYLAMGDMDQNKGDYTTARSMFHKALATANLPKQKAYAHISIAVCYLQQNQLEPAIPELKETAAIPGCPPNLKEAAVSYLSRIAAYQSAHKGKK